MTCNEWLQSVPTEITEDPLWRMEVYREEKAPYEVDRAQLLNNVPLP